MNTELKSFLEEEGYFCIKEIGLLLQKRILTQIKGEWDKEGIGIKTVKIIKNLHPILFFMNYNYQYYIRSHVYEWTSVITITCTNCGTRYTSTTTVHEHCPNCGH